MISRVLLRNWRGYEKLSLDLEPGCTFVVADNGVGKSSLVNGVAWALFGDRSGIDGEAAIRAGAAETTAEVDLVLGDTTVTVTRTLSRPGANGQTTGRSRRSLVVRSDRDDVEAADLPARLSESAAVPLEILPQLMFVPEMRLTHEGNLFADVQDHLASLLGIDELRQAARTARDVAAAAGRRIRAKQADIRLDQEAVEAARSRVADIAGQIEHAAAEVAEDAAQREALDMELRHLDEWGKYDEGLEQHRQRLQALAEEARAVGLDPEAEDVAAASQRVGRQSDELGSAVAEAGAEHALVENLVVQLGEAGAVCPVCLQSIDRDVAKHAAETHQARLAEIARRRVEAERRRGEVEVMAERIREIATALSRERPPEPPRVPRPETSKEQLQARKAELDGAMADKIGRAGGLREQLRQAEETIDASDRAGAATAELERLHTVAATASALAEVAGAEADARTERSLGPLSRTLAGWWKDFFLVPSRPRLAGGGTIELGQGETMIPYPSFSGGEKTLASLLTRLLFVASATGLRTMWLDEPLEHLDPANRTRVARLLAQVTQPGNRMRQVVVTTYEEALARSMTHRHEATHLVYVSTDELV